MQNPGVQAALLAVRAAEEQLGEALSCEGRDDADVTTTASVVAGALELTCSTAAAAAAAAAAAGAAGWSAALKGRVLDVLGQLAVPLIHHAQATGHNAEVCLPSTA